MAWPIDRLYREPIDNSGDTYCKTYYACGICDKKYNVKQNAEKCNQKCIKKAEKFKAKCHKYGVATDLRNGDLVQVLMDMETGNLLITDYYGNR